MSSVRGKTAYDQTEFLQGISSPMFERRDVFTVNRQAFKEIAKWQKHIEMLRHGLWLVF